MKILCKHFLFLLALQRILKSHQARRGVTQALFPPPPQCNVAFKNYATMFVRQPQTKNFFGHKCFAHNLKKYLTNLSVSAACVCVCVVQALKSIFYLIDAEPAAMGAINYIF